MSPRDERRQVGPDQWLASGEVKFYNLRISGNGQFAMMAASLLRQASLVTPPIGHPGPRISSMELAGIHLVKGRLVPSLEQQLVKISIFKIM